VTPPLLTPIVPPFFAYVDLLTLLDLIDVWPFLDDEVGLLLGLEKIPPVFATKLDRRGTLK